MLIGPDDVIAFFNRPSCTRKIYMICAGAQHTPTNTYSPRMLVPFTPDIIDAQRIFAIRRRRRHTEVITPFDFLADHSAF